MSNETVKVMVRCRPMNQNELNKGSKSCVEIISAENQVILKTKEGNKSFAYDSVFATEEKQETIYNKSGFSLVESVVNGYNGTIFAYGQTGCGKTHTMMGYSQSDTEKGIIPRTFDQIVKIIKQQGEGTNYLVRCSFIEIYNEEIHDLLSKDIKQKLDLKGGADGKVYVKDLSMICVKTVEEMEFYMNKGNGNRTTGETLMNKDSSRSHSIFTVYVEQSQIDEKGNERITLGKLNLVDLAGSERLSKTGAQGDRLKEATKINLSLSALGNVISALVDGKSGHIPYRDSKLTRLLQDSLGGNTKTIMIAAISPADYNLDETLGTLRYASRAKNIKNKPKVNEDPKDALLKEYAEEIKRLKSMLQNGQQINLNMDLQIQNVSQLENQSEVNNNRQQNNGNYQEHQNQLRQQNEDIANQLQNEKIERQKLEDMIREMQQNVVQGGGANEEQKQEYQEFKQQLEKQEQQHQLLIQEKKMQEQEFLQQNQNYESLQEEVEHLRKVCEELNKKNKSYKQEIKDIQHEGVVDKEDLADNIRIQQKQLKLYQQITDFVFRKEEIKQIKYMSEWSDIQNDYLVPQITFVDKKLRLPKLNNHQGVDNERNNRDQDNRYMNNQRTPSTKQNTRINYYKKGNVYDSDDDLNHLRKSNLSNTYNIENKPNIYEQESNKFGQINPAKNPRKVHLEPIKSANVSCNEYAKINGQRNKLQPLQGNNKQNKMQVNFKATIHINNNGNIFY